MFPFPKTREQVPDHRTEAMWSGVGGPWELPLLLQSSGGVCQLSEHVIHVPPLPPACDGPLSGRGLEGNLN